MSDLQISSRAFVRRVVLLALLFASELTILSIWLFHSTQVVATKHDWAALLLRSIVGFGAIFIPCGYLKNKHSLKSIFVQSAQPSIRWGFWAAHFVAVVVAVKLSTILYLEGGLRRADWLTVSWLCTGIFGIASAGLAFVSRRAWVQLIRSSGYLWVYSGIAAVSALAVGPYLRRWLWEPGPAINLTFRLTKLFLSLFASGIVANPVTKVIGTQRFQVEILSGCSGLEGVGLVLTFVILWLLIFRKEYRFPRSLVLIPVGVVLIFLLNALRIAGLVLIGNAGAREIAINGFHSQAGWIAFSVVSVGFCFVIQRVPWFTAGTRDRKLFDKVTDNPAAAFLLPFLAVLAAGMVAQAASPGSSFEWLYPLRFFAAGGTLWIFRRRYAAMDWNCDWTAPAIGTTAFAIWITLDHFSSLGMDRDVSADFFPADKAFNAMWITFRVLAAVVTVPIVEELAFRGFLMRRLVSADFESVSFRRFNWFALLVSATVFGAMHGAYWPAGVIAGALFGVALLRRGRMGDAVVAHATANAFLAIYVLTYHKWHLW